MNKTSRWFNLLGVLALTLCFLAASAWLLNLSLPGGAVSAAPDAPDAPGAPLTLPPPWLGDDDVADAPYNWNTPTVDGRIDPGEYAGAGKVSFAGIGGDVEAFFKQDAATLYIALELPDQVNNAPRVSLFVDSNNDDANTPQVDDYLLVVSRDGSLVMEYSGDGSGWGVPTAATSWTASTTETMSGWSIEFGIDYTKLDISVGAFKEIGLAMNNWSPGDNFWPAGATSNQPSTWGSLVSSSDWGTFYWKPGPWEDYAPSGMPDFDQRQSVWGFGPISTHCGPVAVANSLWWYDSKFETLNASAPPDNISDTYRLVTSYDLTWDDHDPQNVGGMGATGLVDDLAWYFNTNGLRYGGHHYGTYITDMYTGTLDYLRDRGLWDDYAVTLVVSPSFEWVADEVQRSEDVVLLLGFYEDLGGGGIGPWARIAGHYVTVAGVDPLAGEIAFSDPLVDTAEMGGPGRVLSGTMLLPHIPDSHTNEVHNDAGNVSHDVYPVVPTNSPGGTWGPFPDMYPMWRIMDLFGVNPHPTIEFDSYAGGEVYIEVEYALAVSPYTWKASGEWLTEGENPMLGAWQPWQDYAPNGMPDFDQKQDDWIDPSLGGWSFCGPVAAANSLWWFDSKFETAPGDPAGEPGDTYPLLWPYGEWDDHDPFNVDDPATPWPGAGVLPAPLPEGTGEFVEELAVYFQTDMTGSGTNIMDMYAGINFYITDHGLRQGYVITLVESPEFWWVAEEVEVSEDVILLLGFWQDQDPDGWVRLGGHYVTLPGVDKQGGLVAFADPWFDRIEQSWPYAGQSPYGVPGWPEYTGRVADGWLIAPHQHSGPPEIVHNDAGNVSHDIYNVISTNSPGGVWGPELYVDVWGEDIENFWGQNGQPDAPAPHGPLVQTEVEWALAVSPVADVWIAKEVTPTLVAAGDWLTFSISFGNHGNLAADVVISDMLHSGLINPSIIDAWTDYGGSIVSHSAYTWTVSDIPWNGAGGITFIAQVDPDLVWPADTMITNTVEITTSTTEQYQIMPYANTAQDAFTVVSSVCVTPTFVDFDWTPASPEAGKVVTFSVNTLLPTTATLPITYQWSFDDGGTASGSSVTHTFALSDSYDVVLTASNPCNDPVWMWHPVDVSGEPDIDVSPTYGFSIMSYPDEIVTDTLGISNAATATANLNWQLAEDPAADWLTKALTSGTVAPGGQDDVVISVDSTGLEPGSSFSTTLEITSNDPDESPLRTVTVDLHVMCRPVDTVTLAITNTGTIYTDTVVYFSAGIEPINASSPYTYVAETDAGLYTGQLTSTAIPLLFDDVFGITGTHNATITVWNCNAMVGVSDVITFTVREQGECVGLDGITIEGATSGEPGSYTFDTGYEPFDASIPIIYTWDDGGDTASSIRSLGVGTHTLMVTATNSCTALPVTDAHEIVINQLACEDVLITGLDSDAPVMLGQAMHFSATVSGDAPITYAWDFDNDGTPEQSGVGLDTVNHSYVSAGTYTVTLNVSNSCPSNDTHSIQVTVNASCVEVTAPTLSISNTGTIYTDTIVYFSADIAPDAAAKPYSYIATDSAGLDTGVQSSSDDPLIFNDVFGVTGTHSATISVWNCGMAQNQALSDVITFSVREHGVCVGLDAITIEGASSGEPGIYTFDANYEPFDASTPITYTWDDGGDEQASIRNLDVGTHTLMVTATNSCTVLPVTDAHEIVISSDQKYIYLPLVMRTHP